MNIKYYFNLKNILIKKNKNNFNNIFNHLI